MGREETEWYCRRLGEYRCTVDAAARRQPSGSDGVRRENARHQHGHAEESAGEAVAVAVRVLVGPERVAARESVGQATGSSGTGVVAAATEVTVEVEKGQVGAVVVLVIMQGTFTASQHIT